MYRIIVLGIMRASLVLHFLLIDEHFTNVSGPGENHQVSRSEHVERQAVGTEGTRAAVQNYKEVQG